MDILTQEYLKSIILYEPLTGMFIWRYKEACPSFKRGGRISNCVEKDGYIQIRISGKSFKAHRLAFLYITGEWPKEQVDHINGIRRDNRWCNIRECTPRENMFNMRACVDGKIKGIRKKNKSYEVTLRINGIPTYLGSYKNLEDAVKTIRAAREKYHKDFCNHGENNVQTK